MDHSWAVSSRHSRWLGQVQVRRPNGHFQCASTPWISRLEIATGKAKRDIAVDLIGALTPDVTKNFSHITDPKQLGQLLRDIEGHGGTPLVKAALRRGETAKIWTPKKA